VVIGAVGGSGTRVFVRVARDGGLFMGSRLNAFEDSEPLIGFYDRWLRRYLAAGRRPPEAERTAMRADLAETLEAHLAGLPAAGGRWGIKVPKTLLMLRFWHETFPDLRFSHVVRSGLDMAYSADGNQLAEVGDLVLPPALHGRPRHVRALAYWAAANGAAADYGEAHMPGRYRRTRFEDLCADPARVIGELFEFWGVPDRAGLPRAVAEVRPPATIGRWRARPAEETAELAPVGRAALARFGYPS
jgi:hypothetical protein